MMNMNRVLKSISNGLKLLAMTWLFLSGCQVAPTTTPIPRVPEIMKTVKVKLIGGDGVVAVNGRTGYTYVAGRFRVTVLKGTEIVGEVETGGDTALSMAVDETNDLVYVVNQYSDNVTVIHGTERIGIVPTVGKQPTSVAIEPRSGFAYVVSLYRSRPLGADVEGNILVLSSTRVIDNLKLEGRVFPWYVIADPFGNYVYAIDLGGKIAVLKELRTVASYDLKTDMIGADVNTRTGEVYILGHQTLFRFKDGRLLDSIELGSTPVIWSISVHPITGDVYVARGGIDPGSGRVLVLRNMKIIAEVQREIGPAVLAADPLTGNVYAANFWDGTDSVTVINGTQKLATIKVGWHPYKIAVNPANGWVYVSNINDSTVTILGYPQNKSTVPPLTGTVPVIPNRPTTATYP